MRLSEEDAELLRVIRVAAIVGDIVRLQPGITGKELFSRIPHGLCPKFRFLRLLANCRRDGVMYVFAGGLYPRGLEVGN